MAPMWYHYAATAANTAPMYYPTTQWRYSYASWPQQQPPHTAKSDNKSISIDVGDGSCGTLEHTREPLGSIDDINDSDDDKKSPASHNISGGRPPLSTLKTEYSSSSTSSSDSSPCNYDENPMSKQYSSGDFEKKLKKFTTAKAPFIRNIRCAPLNLSSVSNDEGKRISQPG